MDLVMAMGFFIMFIVVIAILIYLVYDYIAYKRKVDDAVTFIKDSINSSNARIQRSYNSAIQTITSATSNIENNYRRGTANTVDINDMDSFFKQYFQFSCNVNGRDNVINDKIFDYTFLSDPTNEMYKMKLMKRVEAASGLTVNTERNGLSICSNNSCINVQLRDNVFSVSPANDGNNYLEITDFNKATLANLDLKNKKVFLGGKDADSAPMYLDSGDIKINPSNFKLKGTGAEPDKSLLQILGQMSNRNTKMGDVLDAMSTAVWGSYSNIEFIAQYTLVNQSVAAVGTQGTSSYVAAHTKNDLSITIVPLYDIELQDNLIVFTIPSDDIGKCSSLSGSTINGDANNGITGTVTLTKSSTVSSVSVTANTNVFTVTFTGTNIKLPKHVPISIRYIGGKFLNLESSRAIVTPTQPTTGIVIPTRSVYPTSYAPNRLKTAISAWKAV
jgi:hypothetical protein